MTTNQHQTVTTTMRFILLTVWLISAIGCKSSNDVNWREVTIPASEPRPEIIMRVSPAESASIPLNVYQAEVENAIGFTDSLGVYNANVCVMLADGRLARQGESFTDKDSLLERNSMFVDDQQLEVHSVVFIGFSDESDDGQKKFSFVEPPIICWRAPLDVGLHEAEFQFRQTSGDIQSYSWFFLLTTETGVVAPTEPPEQVIIITAIIPSSTERPSPPPISTQSPIKTSTPHPR
ncbi:MAG: hypothetical protein IPL78_19855 [Chloroflexi bacterium]|nr:hypothetical protein [Chloroflexota bacterium]